jgi:SAM-dependent methyltransferase
MFFYKFTEPLDSPERTITHGKIIGEKVFLKKLYRDWYQYFIREKENFPSGKLLLEIGSGGGFLKEVDPAVICSDVIDLPSNDVTCSALDLPFEAETVGAVFMADVFHHIIDSQKLLTEVNRVLSPGGMLVMVEPANTIFSRNIYRVFHDEPFNVHGGWTIPSAESRFASNMALPWIVFIRDRKLFNVRFPGLQLKSVEYINPILYLLSGGLTMRQLVPDGSFAFFKRLDKALSGLTRHFSMFMVIKLVKKT